MQLESFQIENFRSINNSGPIKASKITALLGRNESGKTNLLLALESLNPVGEFQDLNPIKDFPRHRRLEECNDDTRVVSSVWSLTAEEKRELAAILPRAGKVKEIHIGRNYKGRWVSFKELEALKFDPKDIKAAIRKIVPAVQAVASKLEEGKKTALEQATTLFEGEIEPGSGSKAWATKATKALSALRQALATADVELSEKQEQHLVDMEELAESIGGDEEAQQKARNWAVTKMPIFIYVDEYPELDGHQSITDFIRRKKETPAKLTPADRNFEKLCKVAGINPEELHTLSTEKDPETRNQLANRAGAVVTTEIRRLWKDRSLKVRFHPDAEHLDTLISDPNATYDVEVNLDERSRGFKWFFSFYITFSADTKGGDADGAILLLDEPGLYLHARSQADLLAHLDKDFKNQIIYTTHSPFMVPTHSLDSIRTVNISEDSGTTVTNDPTGDARTLFPLQAALGYSLSQSMFIGTNSLVIEGVTDFWVLSSIGDYLRDTGRISLDSEITLTPAGGAQKISYMVALLTSEEMNVLVLLDEEPNARATKDDLVKTKLIREQNVVFVSEGFPGNPPKEADIEDLLDPDVYEGLVQESYAKELKGKTLKLNPKIPRIAKRIEEAFNTLGIEFHKTRPSRLLLKKMATDPEKIVTEDTVKRFESLFTIVNNRLQSHLARSPEPFV